MGESIIYRNLIELPPNVLSREAFKAGVHERDLLPYAGCIKYPGKGNLWGVHGGIEKLPVLRTRQSQKMTGMTIQSHGESLNELRNSKQEACVITSIAIPGNKLEEEKDLLPLIRRNLECARLPECLRPNLFTSHNSKFEVFPRFDLVHSQYGGLSRRTLKQEIGPATQKALDKLSEILYRKSLYQTDYQTMTPSKDTLINLSGIGCQETSCDPQRPGILSKVLQAMERREIMKKERKVDGYDDNENENEMGIEVEGEKKETNDDSETALDWDKSNKDDHSNDDTLKVKAKKTKAKWLYEKRNASTVLPWRSPYQKPLEDDNVTKSNIVLPQCFPKSLRNHSGQNSSLEINARPISFDESIVRTKAIQRLTLAKKLADTCAPVKLPSMPSKSPTEMATEEMSRDIKLPCLGAMIPGFPPHREGNLKQQRRNTLPLMVGMKFKTDAHIKFHKAHPEPVPDLRDSIIDGKRHVFFGAHAMLLR